MVSTKLCSKELTHVFELLVFVHALNGVSEVLHVEEGRGETKDTWRAVVHQVDEHPVIGAAAQHLAGAHALQALRVTLQHLQEVLWSDILPYVVLGYSRVHVGAVGSVDHHAWSWVAVGKHFPCDSC